MSDRGAGALNPPIGAPLGHSATTDDPAFRARVLCVAAHPDDEILGVGGTLARHAAAGGEVVVVIMSEGEAAKLESPTTSMRREEALAAARAIGTTQTIFHDFPDQRLDTVAFIDLIKPIEAVLRELEPQVVYTHHGGDANSDHLMTFRATYAACRPMTKLGRPVERLLAFETPSSTDQAPPIGSYVFSPTCFVDVERTWAAKIEALRCYPSEMIGGIHPRSFDYVEALARMRAGYAGMRLAEAFVVLRERLPAR